MITKAGQDSVQAGALTDTKLERLYLWLDAFLLQPALLLCVTLAIVAAFLMGFARSGIGAGGFVVSALMVFALGSQIGIAVGRP